MNLHVTYSSDNNYAHYMATSIYSLLDNNRDFENISIHILDNGIEAESKQKIDRVVSDFKREVIYYDLSAIDSMLGTSKVETISTSSYSRLFLSEVLPKNIDHILYLDCDSLVTGSFLALLKATNWEKIIYGVEDVVPQVFKTKIGMATKDKYINAGMMLMNLNKIREGDYYSKIRDTLDNCDGEFPHHDQGIINYVFSNNIGIIAANYNILTPFFLFSADELKKLYSLDSYYSNNDIRKAIDAPVFVHFTKGLIQRPWHSNCDHPFTKLFLSYYKKANHSDCQLESDTRNIKSRVVLFLYKILPASIFVNIFR